MKNSLPPRAVARDGITLVELTAVIVVLLALVGLLTLGSRAWKRAASRSTCLMDLRNVQMAVRSYQNLRGYGFGAFPDKEYGTRDISRHLLEKGFITPVMFFRAQGSQPCTGGGTCLCEEPERFPVAGDLYMKCSLAESEDHQPDPDVSSGW